VAWKTEVKALDARPRHPRAGFEIAAGEVPFRRNGDAAEDVLIEAYERPPVAGDEIRVSVLRVLDHLLLPAAWQRPPPERYRESTEDLRLVSAMAPGRAIIPKP